MSDSGDDVAGRVRVRADRDVCIGAGNCVMTVAEVFDQDDAEGLVVVRQERPGPDLSALVRQAADLCPSGAITIDAER